MKLKSFSKFYPVFIVILLCFVYGLFLTHPFTLVTADLGRHLKNGQIFLQTLNPITTNYYSYTHPDFPATNHHWLSGLFFQLIYQASGFTGLHLTFIALSLLTLAIFLKITAGKTNLLIVTLTTLLAIPLIAHRREIRPEVFSYLLGGIYFYLISGYLKQKQKKYLLALPLLQILWVNLHIYFFVGLGLIALSLLFSFATFPLLILLAALFGCLLNPFGLSGALTPLTIFNDYGYRLVENQPVWFIEKLIYNPNFTIFKLVFFTTIVSYFLLFITKKRIDLFYLAIFVFTGLAAFLAIRNFTFFGLFIIPILSQNLTGFLPNRVKINLNKLDWLALVIILLFLPVVALNSVQKSFFGESKLGLGVYQNDNEPIVFFKENDLKGPIFNNYDIGGYLIFQLFPQEKVFVDNRPEAYPVSFFENLYIPIQQDEYKWQKAVNEYQFNTIIFSYHDATPWGQAFLISRIKDQQWRPVFINDRVIIFVKNNQQNKSVIEKHQLDENLFKISKT